VGVLRGSGALGLPGALVGADIGFTVGPCDILLGGSHRFVRNAQAVGTHIGDQTHGAVACNIHAFVQGLGSAHGAGGRKAQPAGCLLLQGAGDESRSGLLCPLALFQLCHHVLGPFQTLFNGPGLGFVFGQQLLALGIGSQTRRKALVACAEGGVHVPVFVGLEALDLLFAVIDQPHSHALHAACGQAPAHLAPEERAELVAHQTIQHPAGLLGVEQILVNGAGVGHALLHALFGDLVKGDAVGLVGVQPQNVCQMPADSFAFAVRVGRQQHAVCVFGLALELLDELFLAFDADVLRSIAVLHIDAQLRRGQVADMAHACGDFVVIAQIFADGLRLGRRLHDNQFRHSSLLPFVFLSSISKRAVCTVRDLLFLTCFAGRTVRPAYEKGFL